MSRLIFILMFLLSLQAGLGCSASRNGQDSSPWLPDLWYQDQLLNQAIINRQPEYERKGKQGNKVKNEFAIHITELNLDRNNNRIRIKGFVAGKGTGVRFNGIDFKAVSPQKLIREGEVSIFKGSLVFESAFFDHDLIKVSHKGYRTLFIDPTKLVEYELP